MSETTPRPISPDVAPVAATAKPAPPRPAAKKKAKKTVTSITFHSFPQLIYTWPLLVLGYVYEAMAQLGFEAAATSTVAGWVYVITLIVVLQTVAMNLNRNQTIFCLILVGLIALGIYNIADYSGGLFAGIGNWLASITVTVSPDAVLVVSILLSFLFAIMFFLAFFNDRWRVTHNEIEHRRLGDSEDAIARGAKNARTKYPDIMEAILGFGAGTLLIYSTSGRQLIREIPNVMFLAFRKKKISRLLESTATVRDLEAEAIAEEEAEEEDAAL